MKQYVLHLLVVQGDSSNLSLTKIFSILNDVDFSICIPSSCVSAGFCVYLKFVYRCLVLIVHFVLLLPR